MPVVARPYSTTPKLREEVGGRSGVRTLAPLTRRQREVSILPVESTRLRLDELAGRSGGEDEVTVGAHGVDVILASGHEVVAGFRHKASGGRARKEENPQHGGDARETGEEGWVG